MKRKQALLAAGIALVVMSIGFAALNLSGTESGKVSTVNSSHEGNAEHLPNSVYLTTTWQENDLVDIAVNANRVDAGAVFAAVMNLSYNGEDFEFVSYEEGNYFDQAGSDIGKKEPVYLVSDRPVSVPGGEHRLAIGISLFKGSPGLNGSGRLITLRFKAKQPSGGQIFYTKKKLVDTDTQEITQILWPESILVIPS